ncbi:riboflavin synthase [Candidatus Persebacteraceae bacterium Df01]|uniref:Riboflavin synthase n=1 Tax=Candidatus Doriopsillibacter californiensis TaxID=2970740 RepID=A0ABT7QKS5_9GAMM|nr:riboflavin synthase [Candidatus Persebacteraceae bacterium Df01]
MFTGIITAIGRIDAFIPAGSGARLRVCTPTDWLQSSVVGDSIAVNGTCLTAIEINNDCFTVDLSAETLGRCTPWQNGTAVNLEQALAVGDKLGGHFVTGHVEGIAHIDVVEEDGAGGQRWRVVPPPALLPLLAEKGAVALAGVSLTVCDVNKNCFFVNLVPHTLSATTLGQLTANEALNIETDMLARHVARLLALPSSS